MTAFLLGLMAGFVFAVIGQIITNPDRIRQHVEEAQSLLQELEALRAQLAKAKVAVRKAHKDFIDSVTLADKKALNLLKKHCVHTNHEKP